MQMHHIRLIANSPRVENSRWNIGKRKDKGTICALIIVFICSNDSYEDETQIRKKPFD